MRVLRAVCVSARISEKLHKNVHVARGRGRSSIDDSAIRYVLPVLRMTSCVCTLGPMACGIGSIYVSAVLQHVVINFLCVSRGAALIELVGDDDVWGTAIGWRPTACSIKAGGAVCYLRLRRSSDCSCCLMSLFFVCLSPRC